MVYDHYNDYCKATENIAMALYSIAGALDKLPDNIGKQEQDSQAIPTIKELVNISNKVDQLYQAVETTRTAEDIEQIKDQLGQIQGHLAALNRLIQKKESP